MGHKVRPTSLRLGITEEWRSQWFANKKQFGEYLVEDQMIRTYIKHHYFYAGVARIDIRRTRGTVHVTARCARPGLMIGRRGVEVERLKAGLDELTQGSVEVAVEEVTEPLLDAQLVAEDVAQQIERRISHKRAMRQAIQRAMRFGALGVMVTCAGRLHGAEMARRESAREGQVPRHTLRADIDYAQVEALTTYGRVDVKVWIYKGEVLPEKAPAESTSP